MNTLRDSLLEKEAALEAARVERQRLLDEFSSRESTLENTIQSHITQIRRDKETFEREKASILELKEEELGKLRAKTEALQSQVDDLTARIEDLSAEAYVREREFVCVCHPIPSPLVLLLLLLLFQRMSLVNDFSSVLLAKYFHHAILPSPYRRESESMICNAQH